MKEKKFEPHCKKCGKKMVLVEKWVPDNSKKGELRKIVINSIAIDDIKEF